MNTINLKKITVICHKYTWQKQLQNRDIYKYYTTKLQILREEKEDEGHRKKIITVIILTKNNDIYNTGIVTSNSKAIYVFMD